MFIYSGQPYSSLIVRLRLVAIAALVISVTGAVMSGAQQGTPGATPPANVAGQGPRPASPTATTPTAPSAQAPAASPQGATAVSGSSRRGLIEDIGTVVQVLSLVVVAVALVYSAFEFHRNSIIQRQDMYLRLELASNELFRTTIEFPQLWTLYGPTPTQPLTEQQTTQLDDYAASVLNLFNIIFDMHSRKEIDSDVFPTWLPWFRELCSSDVFKRIWSNRGLDAHYSPDFRAYINSLCRVNPDDELKFYETAGEPFRGDLVIKTWMRDPSFISNQAASVGDRSYENDNKSAVADRNEKT